MNTTTTTTMTITVRWTHPGFHAWPEAPSNRAYLRDRHRHLFYYELTIPVAHADRQVEFHDLLECAKAATDAPERDRKSCEDMATNLIKEMRILLGEIPMTCSVFEDNEVGATVSVT